MQTKTSFKNDYSEGAASRVLELLVSSNDQQETGYGEDTLSIKAKSLIKNAIGNQQAEIYFVSGGTMANILVISHLLKPYESVIAADSSHIQVHETGAIENCGHKINLVKNSDGKIDIQGINQIIELHSDQHMVKPAMVYISQTTELGSIYSKKELTEISTYCKKNDLLLFIDGARLGVSLTAKSNDLTLMNIANLCDVFYIGATKNGGLLGEAIVFPSPQHANGFPYYLKQKGALMAKGRLLGAQFCALFEDQLYFDLANNANLKADQIANAISNLGYKFLTPAVSNQIFAILPNALIDKLLEHFEFYIWEKLDQDMAVVRFVTSWATSDQDIKRFVKLLHETN